MLPSLTRKTLARKNTQEKRLVFRLKALSLLKNMFSLYFSPISKLWARKKVVSKVLVFWRYSKTLIKYLDFVSKSSLSSNYLRSNRKYMSSINRVSISEEDSSRTPVSWSFSCELLGVVWTNPSMWAKERRNAYIKENLSMSICHGNFLLYSLG